MTTTLPPQHPHSPNTFDWWGVNGPKDSVMSCPRCLSGRIAETDQYFLNFNDYTLTGPGLRCFHCGHEFVENEADWMTWAEARGLKEVR